ncbi:MAG TPA: cbb3-type cytochrome c oxidase N-terminal domain-containing protein [Vicinamibacterales bacterium]|nr:cbb3-type cytochrome c oxidase N-terminal domain-containing protein [Vicinamibacterales bacterium]
MSRDTHEKPDRDELLDHDADGIKEFDNALPRWWLYGFYFTIVFAGFYLVNYHLLPRPLIGRAGMVAEYQAELEAASRAAAARPHSAKTGVVVAALTDAASLEKGRAIFDGANNTCFACHRNDLGGLVGPNLTDDLWLHGCSIQDVMNSVTIGYPLKGMVAFGTGKPLTDEQVLQVASYVMSKRGSSPPAPKPPDAEREKACK